MVGDACAIGVCSIDYAQLDYILTYGDNLAYCVIFSVFLLVQLGLLWKHRTWGSAVGMFCGLLLEVLGYAGRITLSGNLSNLDQSVL
ncbi:hypothetical protein E4T52_16936 [Aureobasidium sp. EXF-3400]|nr:hypothetical protein E4T51_16187 [Aureobasidium sp. EXF-12344]KAI4767954.1 hypothetical protein E4T52_16936 [Aureobasidium sp. EXF-3400]